MSTATIPSTARSRHLAFVHAQAKLFDLDPKSEAYRAWLKRRTGTTSCRELDDAALAALCASLKATGPQWYRCYQLARALGFTDLHDAGFLQFLSRVTKETVPWHLSRQQLSNLIIAMNRWLDHKTRKAAGGGESSSAEAPAPLARPDTTGGTGGPSANEKAPADDTCQGSTPVSRSRILKPSRESLQGLLA